MIGMERIKDCKVGQISWWFHLVLTRVEVVKGPEFLFANMPFGSLWSKYNQISSSSRPLVNSSCLYI